MILYILCRCAHVGKEKVINMDNSLLSMAAWKRTRIILALFKSLDRQMK